MSNIQALLHSFAYVDVCFCVYGSYLFCTWRLYLGLLGVCVCVCVHVYRVEDLFNVVTLQVLLVI